MTYHKPLKPAADIADVWAAWCGEDNDWVRSLREFGRLGGLVTYWCGVPRSHSAIPLTFALHAPDGTEFPDQRYRLKDIKAAVKALNLAKGN